MDEPLVLAIETSSRVGSVALGRGSALLAESTFSAPLQHSAEIFPAINQLLSRFDFTPDDIGHVYVATGPGSFTGLRIAVTMAKAMHLADNRIVIATVNSLDVIVANIGDAAASISLQDSGGTMLNRVAAVLDAKRGEFYAAVYERVGPQETPVDVSSNEGYVIAAPQSTTWRKILPDCLITANDLTARFATDTPLGVLGDGLVYHREEFATDNIRILDESYWSPRASSVYRLGRQKAAAGRFTDALTLTPFYLRAPHVTVKKAGI